MHCKICNSNSYILFNGTILQKYDVTYYKCEYCGFIQTEEAYWLDEAYHSAITSLDIGYVTRNLMYRDIVTSIIKRLFNRKSRFIDFGGGYGLFVRLMRDLGFDYYRQDAYCDNIFAKKFDVTEIDITKFDMLTAFEVFEHLSNPLSEFGEMLKYSESILLSTTLQPLWNIKAITDWDYFAPETGQHIAFYTKKTLTVIAEKYNLNLYTNDKDLHLFTSKKIKFNYIKYISYKHRLLDKIFKRNFRNKKTLIQKDVEYIKSNLNK